MPQTLCHLLIHCVFHKKVSAPTIRDIDQRRLNIFIKDTCENYGCSCIIANGPGDHLHLLTTLSPEIPLSTFIKEIKRLSSRFLKECDSIYYHNFYWQSGYAGFSVSRKFKKSVYQYIITQKEHHQKRSTDSELEALLRNAGIDSDHHYWK